jgi:hypothetical protein
MPRALNKEIDEIMNKIEAKLPILSWRSQKTVKWNYLK